jgi:hypothetical protein
MPVMPEAEMAEPEPELALDVRLLGALCLWVWELRTRDGRVLESSWETQWAAFASREDAEAAGRRRLAELVRARKPGARFSAIPPTVPRAG